MSGVRDFQMREKYGYYGARNSSVVFHMAFSGMSLGHFWGGWCGERRFWEIPGRKTGNGLERGNPGRSWDQDESGEREFDTAIWYWRIGSGAFVLEGVENWKGWKGRNYITIDELWIGFGEMDGLDEMDEWTNS